MTAVGGGSFCAAVEETNPPSHRGETALVAAQQISIAHSFSDRLILYHLRVPQVSLLRPGKAGTPWNIFIRSET
jgi:hypothetical protein